MSLLDMFQMFLRDSATKHFTWFNFKNCPRPSEVKSDRSVSKNIKIYCIGGFNTCIYIVFFRKMLHITLKKVERITLHR